MYYLQSIKAENLFSWKSLDINFNNNTAYSFVGDNGAGKSSIFEIIMWVLFKKTTKKSVKGDFGKTDGYGMLTLMEDNLALIIKRDTKAPTAIEVINADGDNETKPRQITQEELEDIIGCNYSVFMASIMCSQERVSSFVNEASDSGKAKIFGDMLGCDILDKMRKKLVSEKSSKEVQYESILTEVRVLRETMEEKKLELDDQDPTQVQKQINKDRKWLEKLDKELVDLEAKRKKYMEVNDEWIRWERNQENLASIEASLKPRIKRIREMIKKYKSININGSEKSQLQSLKYKEAIEQVGVKLFHLRTNLKKLMDIIKKEGSTCPTCGQKIQLHNKNSIENSIEHLRLEIQHKEEHKDTLVKKQNKWDKIVTDLMIKRDEKEELKRDIKFEKNVLAQSKSTLERVRDSVQEPKQPKKNINTINEELNMKASNRFSLSSSIENRVRSLKAYRKAENRLEVAVIKLKKKEKVYNIYVWLFKHLPLMKLRYLNENRVALEEIINEYMSNMGVPFIVRIDTQKELKTTKEIKDSFSFQIVNSVRDRKAHNKDLSGGEKTCILLATQFGINDISNVRLGFEIYDEVYGSLDKKNVAVVIEAIQSRAKQKQVFTISHDPEISNSFDQIYRITNKKGYSSWQKS